jgi:hypothetical protein
MEEITLEKLLRIALIAFGAIFFTIYPAQPLLAVGLAVAQWPWPILLADVMRGLRGSRCLSHCCRA